MSQFSKRFIYIFFVSSLVAGSVFWGLRASAEKHLGWLTADEKELAVIQQIAAARNQKLDVEVVNRKNGIAIVRGNEKQFEEISNLMHEAFHKCSGFLAHESEAEAEQAIDDAFAANPYQQFIDYTIDNQSNVSPMLAEAQEPNVRQTIIDLSAFPNRRHNLQGGLDGANWIKNKWTQLAQGRSDVTVEFFVHPTATTPQPSVILTIQGTTLPNEEIVLGGHQDSINSGGQSLPAPGADDDASGIATLTEAIRVLMAKNFRPNRTVKFMAYAAEEVGLRGSAAIALDYRTRNVNVVGVIQFDMTNYKGTPAADIVIFQDYANVAQNTFVQNLITTYQPALSIGTSQCGYGCSDHASWFNRSYPTSMPCEATFADVNSALHTANDTIARSNNNANHALKFTKLALSYVGELAKGTLAPIRKTIFDFDADGKSDVSVFRPSNGVWYLQQSTAGFTGVQFGLSTDTIVPADFDGDNKTDVAVYRSGTWYLLRSTLGFTGVAFGDPSDIAQPADFDGDGKAELAVFRPSNGTWYVLNLVNSQVTAFQFGAAGDRPVAADYDGDAKADYAVYRDGIWYLQRSQLGFTTISFGSSGDKPVVGDYDGDGKTDVAVFRPSIGGWYILNSSDSAFVSYAWGLSTDIPTPGDYDGDGKFDVAIYRPSTGYWYVLRSSSGSLQATPWGISTDIPIPSTNVP